MSNNLHLPLEGGGIQFQGLTGQQQGPPQLPVTGKTTSVANTPGSHVQGTSSASTMVPQDKSTQPAKGFFSRTIKGITKGASALKRASCSALKSIGKTIVGPPTSSSSQIKIIYQSPGAQFPGLFDLSQPIIVQAPPKPHAPTIREHEKFNENLKTTEDAKKFLQDKADGSYVIRFSESAGKYYVCMKGKFNPSGSIEMEQKEVSSHKEIEKAVKELNTMRARFESKEAPSKSPAASIPSTTQPATFAGHPRFRPLDTTEAAAKHLQNEPPGSWIVRYSPSQKNYFVCMKGPFPGGTAMQQLPVGTPDKIDTVVAELQQLRLQTPVAPGKSDAEFIKEFNQGDISHDPFLPATLLEGKPPGTCILRQGTSAPGSFVFLAMLPNYEMKEIRVTPDPHSPGKWRCHTNPCIGKQFNSLEEVTKDPNFQALFKNPLPKLQHHAAAPFHAAPMQNAYAKPLQPDFGPPQSGPQFQQNYSLPQGDGPPLSGPQFQQNSGQYQSSAKNMEDPYNFSYEWKITPHTPVISNAAPAELLSMAATGAIISPDSFMAAAEGLRKQTSPSQPNYGETMTTLHELYSKAAEGYQKAGDIGKAFQARRLAAEHATPSSKLYDMKGAIDKGQKAQRSPNLPAHFSNLDTGALKGGHVRASNRTINGQPKTQVEFKLTKPARRNLQTNINSIRTNLADFMQNLPPELQGKRVTIREVPDQFLGKDALGFTSQNAYSPGGGLARALEVEFEGVGTVTIGNSADYSCLYNSVKVSVDQNLPPGKAEAQVHQMLTMLGVGPIMNDQRSDDQERIKLAQMFRAHFPREAVTMERTAEFYTLPVAELRKKITTDVPEMKAVIEKYEKNPALIGRREVFPGREVFTFNDISREMKKNGAIGLMAGVGGAPGGDGAASARTIGLMLRTGALSSQDRFQAGLFAAGASSDDDLRTGGGDQVFTRLINHNTTKNSAQEFSLSGQFQILYDLDAVNGGAYGYHEDTYGAKSPLAGAYRSYENRSNLPELAKAAARTDNEIMIPNTIPPNMIRGIMCQTEENKKLLIGELTEQGVIIDGKINGVPVNNFIHVSSHFTEEMWATG